MVSERSLAIISQSIQLKKPVRLVLFTTDMACALCPDARDLVHAIKAHMNRIALETYDMIMDRDKSELYGIRQVPAIVVQGGEGQKITFYGMVEDVFLEILMETIHALADTKVWFPDEIRRTLKHLGQDVKIRVFVETDCQLCRPVAETAIGLAMESRLIDANVIVASDFPELIKKHKVTTLPTTIFGENLFMEGHVTEGEFLEMIFQAEGIKPAPDRQCLVCGNATPEVICEQCKTRIRAEALDHKLRTERTRSHESS
jgi:alkyl hydroperoxide reductase subunit AhpF